MNGGKRTKTIISAVFACSALLTAAACGSADTQSSAVKAAPAGLMSPSGMPADPSQEPGGMADLEKAGAAAMAAVEGSTILSVQAENDGRLWEVQLAEPAGTERVLEVDSSGKVVSEPRVKDTGEGEKARVMGIIKDAKITFQDAVEKVSSAMPEGKITHLSLDRYNNDMLVWDGDVVSPDGAWQGVKVDAKTGTVTKNG
ncbi:PepSY domain-containing protein [Nonomuraea sp. NPDC049152]|uniref:PepSY domain-containing protein n=1 Tax=Nonomuraea sp. NPDC049152 TaxID=3154350 RepID=UPI0033F2E8BB